MVIGMGKHLRWSGLIIIVGIAVLACSTLRDRGGNSGDSYGGMNGGAAQAPYSAPVAIPHRESSPAQPLPSPISMAPVAVTSTRALGVLDHEPLLGILLARGPRLEITIETPAQLEVDGASVAIAPGKFVVEGRAGGWRPAGDTRLITSPGVLRHAGGIAQPAFSVEAIPAFGASVRLRLTGDLLIQPIRGEIQLIERLPMETYLAAVVAKEMNPSWPAPALAAQAIVARSYAAARWVERAADPWQIHWHFGVDMAYPGWRADTGKVAAAIAPTRGEVLMHKDLPVLALFHASSGGRTESFAVIKPGVLGADGRTPIAQAMPVVEDPAALPGAAGLGLAKSHGEWKTDIALPDVTAGLQSWAAKAGGRPTFGTVEAISVQDRQSVSGRVKSVAIRHQLHGKTQFTVMNATDFRLAVSPVIIRSTWWDRCVIAARPPGYLVLEGRGFGHGCGLSQVSAWYLAQQGETPENIVQRFYTGAHIERRY